MSRTTSIATMPTGWQIGRALRQPTRFSDLMALISHTDKLCRVLKKLCNDGLAVKRNDGLYTLTPVGTVWIEAATPLLRWCEQHPRNEQPKSHPSFGNDPVGSRREAEAIRIDSR